MSALTVPVRWTASALPVLRLRSPTGQAELAVHDASLRSALALLDALIVPDPDGSTIAAADLSTPDRDRAMAALLGDTLDGDVVESTIDCNGCGDTFELSFSLTSLVVHREGRDNDDTYLVEPGHWSIGEAVFRFPTGADEEVAHASGDPAGALRSRCITGASNSITDADGDIGGDQSELLDRIEQAMSAMAPTLAIEVGGECPDCGHAHAMSFDAQRYTLAAIQLGRTRLLSDVHVIASHYGWSRNEILDLDRSERRQYVDLVGSTSRRGAPR